MYRMSTEKWQTTFREKVLLILEIRLPFVTDSSLGCINSVLVTIGRRQGAGAGAGAGAAAGAGAGAGAAKASFE